MSHHPHAPSFGERHSRHQNRFEKQVEDQISNYDYSHENSLKHWRAWGSPVGLGLFFISLAVTPWILSQVFGWN